MKHGTDIHNMSGYYRKGFPDLRANCVILIKVKVKVEASNWKQRAKYGAFRV